MLRRSLELEGGMTNQREQGKPTALTSPACQGRAQVLAAGLGIAAFIGDLFNNGMFDAGGITESLQVLVGNMVATEQMRAVDTMLKHCDARLRIAETPALETLLWAFRTNVIRVNASFVGVYQPSDKNALSRVSFSSSTLCVVLKLTHRIGRRG